jgi:hypothetical protein
LEGQYFYVTKTDANYWVNIDEVADLKIDASLAHVSQWEPSIRKYRPDWDPGVLREMKEKLRARAPKKDGHYVEAFRLSRGFSQQ